jgi:energy-coupling factor transporter transmembrane protein EcfT
MPSELFRKIHPLTKFLFLLSFSIVLITSDIRFLLAIFCGFLILLWLAHYNPFSNKSLILFTLGLLGLSTFSGVWIYKLSGIPLLSYVFVLFFKWYVIITTAFIYAREITPSELIYLLRKTSSAPSVVIPFIVGFRILPYSSEVSRIIQMAQKARGLSLKKKRLENFKTFFNSYFVAFLSYFINFLSELGLVLSLRLYPASRKKTFFRIYRFNYLDGLIFAYIVFLFCYLMYLKLL